MTGRHEGGELAVLAAVCATAVVLLAWVMVGRLQVGDPRPEALPAVAVATTVQPVPTVGTTTTAPPGHPWSELADCESGLWDIHGHPIVGTADWASTSNGYEGGVHFTHATWLAYRPAGYPAHAYQATVAQQELVAERVLAGQGAGAWPVCSRKVRLR